jgi:hypothetical protein
MKNKNYMSIKIISFINLAKKQPIKLNCYIESVVIGNVKYINSDYKVSN